MGNIVVLVGYDSVRGFKIKSTDELSGEIKWIPLDSMTWFQCFVTEEDLKGVGFNATWDSDANKMIFRTDRPRVIQELKNAHRIETGEELSTDFTRRTGTRLLDFGFVLKFKRTASERRMF